MEQPGLREDSGAWVAFTYISFGIALTLMCVGIYVLPVVLWIKGYLAMGLFFTVGSTITLSKTVRDNHEARKLVNKIAEVKTERMLQDFELKRSA